MITPSIRAFLPPENEVWGKVIFSEACVMNSVHGGVPCPGGVPGPGRCLVWGCLVWGVPGPGGCAWSGGGLCGDPPMATAAGGTHLTGMHSCY